MMRILRMNNRNFLSDIYIIYYHLYREHNFEKLSVVSIMKDN